MKYFYLLLCVLFVNCSTQTVDKNRPTTQEEEKKQQELLLQKKQSLEKKISSLQQEYNLPGLQAYIFDRTETAFQYAKGVRTVHVPESQITENDKFYLGAQSKIVTALLIGHLIDQKVLDWNTPLSALIPKNIAVNSRLKNVTIDMLMSQRAGLIELQKLKVWPTLKGSALSTKRARELLVQSILSYDPQFEPNSKFESNQSTYVILGFIAEQLTNFSWEELFKNKIAPETNVTNCAFGFAGSLKSETPDQPWGHTLNKFDVISVKPQTLVHDWPKAAFPAQGLSCSALEWGKLLREVNLGLYRESTLLREETFAKMFGPSQDIKVSYSGFMLHERIWAGGKTLVLTSTDPYFTSYSVLAPAREMSLVVLTNSGTPKAQEGSAKVLKLLTEFVQN